MFLVLNSVVPTINKQRPLSKNNHLSYLESLLMIEYQHSTMQKKNLQNPKQTISLMLSMDKKPSKTYSAYRPPPKSF